MLIDTSIILFIFTILFGVIGWLIVNKVSDISQQVKETKDAIISIKEEMIEKHTRMEASIEHHDTRIDNLEKSVLKYHPK